VLFPRLSFYPRGERLAQLGAVRRSVLPSFSSPLQPGLLVAATVPRWYCVCACGLFW
jgi:hypothetical protein